MTLDELENALLPNGLHDARLVGLNIDYRALTAILDVNVDTSTPPESGPVLRRAHIVFSGVQFVIVDPPGPGQEEIASLPMIDSGAGEPDTAPIPLPVVRSDCFLSWIYVTDWNSFIRIAARDAALEWRPAQSQAR